MSIYGGGVFAAAVSSSAILVGLVQGLGIVRTSDTVVTIQTGCAADSTNVSTGYAAATKAVDLDVAGAGGLQSGSSKTNATFYKIHLIWKADGTSAGFAVPQGTAITLPAGYLYYRYIGSLRYGMAATITSEWLGFADIDGGSVRSVLYDNVGTAGDYVAYWVLNAGAATSTTLTSIDCSTLIPATSRRGYFATELRIPAAGGGRCLVYVGQSGTTIVQGIAADTEGNSQATDAGMSLLTLSSSQTLGYRNTLASCVTYISVRGYMEHI